MKYLKNELLLIQLGKRIKEIRISQQLTQDQLAYECGINRSQVIRIESGKLNRSISQLSAISTVFGITLSALFEELDF